MNIRVEESSLEEAFKVHKQIPEFAPNPPFTHRDFKKKLGKNEPLVLVGYLEGEPVGYSIGYDKFIDGSFYSWIGGVVPQYRQHGVYKAIRNEQEKWAKKNGYRSIKIKTRNNRPEMRIALVKLGYNLIAVEEKADVADFRLVHEKDLARR